MGEGPKGRKDLEVDARKASEYAAQSVPSSSARAANPNILLREKSFF